MFYTRKRDLFAAVLAGALCLTSAYAQKASDGVPTEPTAQLACGNLDFLRGAEVFLNHMPAASIDEVK